ncbi:putative hydroxymethylpyrimidine transport system permease protein [Rhizobium azooxidifex]|uniref:Putative hydroxymethylpyrimidine transport system permease protein n=1 Tax=Mycoplana azooxidifex TaxID=1636188 RepID=A0A7W6D9C6_9HYPH|nr:ABC transporter permease [Mycoplana azooxidifex]MBB3977051.1 putative hydroxymethylpyrimidine transport system permease protein [Mycoplana azooxidifex]
MRALHAGLATVTLAALWQASVWLFAPPPYLLPSPAAVVSAFAERPGFFAGHSLVTMTEILAGLLTGTLFGTATAFGIAALPRFGQLVWPMVLILQAFPVFVLAPILVLWLGFGMASKVAMTTIIIFFPVASAFADGLRRTDRTILDAVSLTPATHWQALLAVRVPLALPGLISGLRVAAPLAPLGAVVGEWVGASAGLGFVMVQANARMQTATVFAAMAVLAALTVLLRLAVDRLTAGLTPWAEETETPSFNPLRRRPRKP